MMVNNTPTAIRVELTSSSSSNGDISINQTYGAAPFRPNGISCTLNANRLTSEIPYPGAPANFPTAIFALVTISGGGGGNILPVGTKMLIEQLTVNVP
jgi:hypothetical protein